MFRMLILLTVGLLLLSGCSDESFTVSNQEVPTSLLAKEQSIRQGQELFLRLCRECHGTLGEGRNQRAKRFIPPAPDFHERHYAQSSPAYLFWRIQDGKRSEPFRSRGSVMPSWKPHLTEEQMWQLVAYLMRRSQGGY